MSTSFVHLNLHSEYSLIDGTIRIPKLIKQVRRLGMPAVAVTDISNLFGMVKFLRAARAAGIKPIVGADIWLHNPDEPRTPHRLLLLCCDREGYHNLCVLLSDAYRHRGHLPEVMPEWLERRQAGLIAISCAREGDVSRALLAGHPDRARDLVRYWQGVFGDRFYLELSRTGREDEERCLRATVQVAADCECPAVATNRVRFLKRDDFAAHEARVCIHDGRALNDPRRPRRYVPEQYLKSPQEMAEAFADLPGALANTVEIATRCNLDLELGHYVLPAFPVPEGMSEAEYLKQRSEAGLRQRLAQHGLAADHHERDYFERMALEMEVITSMGFPGYFLIVADFIRWARENGVPVGPGRGSGAGSVVAWALGITDLDPLRYELLFERFLNPERVSMPDFDIDFCMERRDEVIDYVARTYGQDQVSQIITFGTMAARAVVRDCGRVLGHPYGYVDQVAKKIPTTLGIKLAAALEEDDELKRAYAEDEDVREIIDLAMSLEGIARNAGRHAGGVVIAPSTLTDFTPLYREQGSEGVVTQFDKDDVELAGLVKFDFLGLRTLTIIHWAVQTINRLREQAGETPVDLVTLPMDDARSFALLQSCQTTAVFQLESRGMKDLIRRLRPDSFEDIIALVALFRPGPLQSGMVDDFIDRKHGRAEVVYPHPKLEPILAPTYGVILYQEQVMQIAQVLAGYSLGAADLLRRAMGKKKPEEMAKQRTIFVEGAEKRGVEPKLADSIFDLMEKFAGYGFNKSHSACYALIAYQTAWLKAHYPAAFMAAVLSSDMDNTDKVVIFIDECQQIDIALQAPDVNRSQHRFTVVDDSTVLYGLGAIKGVGLSAIECIIEEREARGPFASLFDLCRRIDSHKVNRRVLEALILSGAADALGANRASMLRQLPTALQAAEQAQRDHAAGQNDMFGAPTPPPARGGDPVVIDEMDERERLAGERLALGLYFSGHPINPHRQELARLITCELAELATRIKPANGNEQSGYGRNQGQPCVVAGLVTQVRRRGSRMAFVTLDDRTARVEAGFFDQSFRDAGPRLNVDEIVVIEGRASHDDFSGGVRLSAKTAYTLDEAREQFARHVEIRLRGNGSTTVPALKQALSAHRGGKAPVWIDFMGDTGRARFRLSEDWQVRVSTELSQALESVNGVEQVRIVY